LGLETITPAKSGSQGLIEGSLVLGRRGHEVEAREHDGVGALGREQIDQSSGLARGSSHDHAAAKQGALLEPLDPLAQRDDVTHDHHRGRTDRGLLDAIGDVRQRADDGLLDAPGPPPDHGGGRARVAARVDQSLGVGPRVLDAHHQDQGPGAVGQVVPRDLQAGLFVGLVARHEADRGGVVAMCDRDPSRLWRGDR
jgi:hypothetical protein